MSLYITADIQYKGQLLNVELPISRMYFDTYISGKLNIPSFDVLLSDEVIICNFEGFEPIENWQLSYSAANHLVVSLQEISDVYLKHADDLTATFYDGDLWDFIYNVNYGAVKFESSIKDFSDLAHFLLREDDVVDYDMWYRYVDWHELVKDYPDLCTDIPDERERGIAISHRLDEYAPDLLDYTDLDRLGSALKSYVVDCLFTEDGCFYKLQGEV